MAKINNNYNVPLNQFADWADQAIKSGKNGGDRMVKVWDGRQSLPKMSAGGKTKTFKERTISGAQQTGVQQSVAKQSAPKGIVSWNQSKTISKADNNTARATLLNSIRKELGLKPDTPIKDFPSGVKKAMNYGFFAKLFNYYNDWSADNGRPLSARNIKAITDAVKAEQTSKAMSGLASLGKEVSAIVKGDKELQEALKNNPKGAAQLCKALKDNKHLIPLFVSKENGFREAVTVHLQNDKCQVPLPVGKYTVKSEGLEDIRNDVNKLFQEAASKAKNVGEYNAMLNQCIKDYGRIGFLIYVGDGKKPFDLMAGLKRVDGQYVEDESTRKQMDVNMSRLINDINKLNHDGQKLPNSNKTKIQLMEFITQGGMTATTIGPSQIKRFSFPGETMGLDGLDQKTEKFAHVSVLKFSAKGGKLKINQTTNVPVKSVGNLLYDGKTSYIKTSLDFELGASNGDVLKLAKVRMPDNAPETTINLDISTDAY